jgi:hypothetical protein
MKRNVFINWVAETDFASSEFHIIFSFVTATFVSTVTSSLKCIIVGTGGEQNCLSKTSTEACIEGRATRTKVYH